MHRKASELRECNLFILIPAALGREFVENWLDVRSVAMLDQAHCSSESRSQFLRQTDGTCLRNIERKDKPVKAANFVKWLKKRTMAAVHLPIPICFDHSLLSWMKSTGPRVASISFESDWMTRVPEVDLTDIVGCFPNMAHFDWTNLAFCILRTQTRLGGASMFSRGDAVAQPSHDHC